MTTQELAKITAHKIQPLLVPGLKAMHPAIYTELKDLYTMHVALSLVNPEDAKKIIAPGGYEIPPLKTTPKPQARVATEGCCG